MRSIIFSITPIIMQSNQHLQPGRIIIASLILYLFSTGISFAQDNDVTECPYFNVVSTDTAGVVFSLISTNVNATVSGVIANVEVEQMYLNAGDSTIDATYVFPMSSKAAVYGMEMIVNERTIRAEIRRKDEAQAIFDDANEYKSKYKDYLSIPWRRAKCLFTSAAIFPAAQERTFSPGATRSGLSRPSPVGPFEEK